MPDIVKNNFNYFLKNIPTPPQAFHSKLIRIGKKRELYKKNKMESPFLPKQWW